MDIIFATDILLNFNTGFYRKGVIIMKRKTVIFTYLRTWFLIDILATFPYEYSIEYAFGAEHESVQQLSQAPQLLRMLKLVRFLRILRLLRVFKLKKFLYKIQEYIVTDVLGMIMDIVKLLVMIFFISHWMACIFYYIGDYDSTDDPDNWIAINNLEELNTGEKYIVALYFAFTTVTTVGYGDITPQTNNEKVVMMFGMIIA